MYNESSLHMMANEVLESEWQRFVSRKQSSNSMSVFDICSLRWLLPDLVQMIQQSHERPVQELSPTIRCLLVEQHFADDNGDNVIDVQEEALVNEMVDLLVRVLLKVRAQAIHVGQWSDAPVTPIMFG